VLKDIPRFAAITVVAPTVRFNALAIFLGPFFSRASDFNNRRSSLVQGRLAGFFFFISAPFVSRAFIMAHSHCNAPSKTYLVHLFERFGLRVVSSFGAEGLHPVGEQRHMSAAQRAMAVVRQERKGVTK
jgi:hypothetical protein